MLEDMPGLGAIDLHEALWVRREGFAAFVVPDDWHAFPLPVQEGMAWWTLMRYCLNDRDSGELFALSALYDISITICSTPEEVHAVQPREDTFAVRAGILRLCEQLEKGVGRVAVCQYAFDRPEQML